MGVANANELPTNLILFRMFLKQTVVVLFKLKSSVGLGIWYYELEDGLTPRIAKIRSNFMVDLFA